MKTEITDNFVKLWLDADDTYCWAHNEKKQWPGSRLSGNRLFAKFDSSGLVNYIINGQCNIKPNKEILADEFNAITSDILKNKLPKDHKCYFVCVGQFIE